MAPNGFNSTSSACPLGVKCQLAFDFFSYHNVSLVCCGFLFHDLLIYCQCFTVSCPPAAFSLDGSGLSFADLFRLVAFCCISRWGRCNTWHMLTQTVFSFLWPTSYKPWSVGGSTFDLDTTGSDEFDLEGRKSWRLIVDDITSVQCFHQDVSCSDLFSRSQLAGNKAFTPLSWKSKVK